MKVALIINNITNSAGTERVVVNLSNCFVAKGITVEIHSLSTTGGTAFFALHPDVRILHHGLDEYANETSVFRKLYYKIRNTIRSRHVFKNLEGNILIGTGKNINFYLALFSSGKKAARVGCEHFTHSAPMSPVIRKLRNRLYARLEKLVVLNQTDLAYYSQYMNNVVCIPNFIAEVPAEYSRLDQHVALAIGRHNWEKGFDTLLHVWQKVNKTHPGWKLRIVGNGPLLQQHIDLAGELAISDAVIFEPPNNDLSGIYQNASLYIMTSRTEGFPMVLLEAMSRGLPCVSFDCEAGPRDMILHNETGYLIPPDHTDEMVSSINNLIANPHQRASMQLAARRHVEMFTVERIGGRWVDLFKALQKT
nr:glycosyltransferase family 4 protein [uncultured Chitinophaga sp.]